MKLIVVALLLWPTLNLAQEPNCDSNNLCTILRPAHNDSGQPVLLHYSFKYRAPKNGAPTLVYVPGGPGGTSVDIAFDDLGKIPEEFGIILTDPRFVGVNEMANPEDFTAETTSIGVASDLLAAVKSVSAKDFILWGSSYGTIPVTIAAANAGSDQPRAVILDGTFAKAIEPSEFAPNFIYLWKSFEHAVNPETLRAFKTRVKDLIHEGEFTSKQFGLIIEVLLVNRHDPIVGGDQLEHDIYEIGHNPIEKTREQIRLINSNLSDDLNAHGKTHFHTWIACKEGLLTNDIEFYFDGEELTAVETSECESFKSRTPYDSKNYQIHSPIFYVQGELDPATPMSQVKYHLQNQTHSADKYLVTVKNGEHAPLITDLKACTQNFWLALAKDFHGGVAALAPCSDSIK